MRFTHALMRLPSANFADGLTTANEGTPSFELALAQHAAYARALHEAGLAVTMLEALPAFPDACFVEDVAVITPEVAVITRPGAAARLGEEAFIEPALARVRKISRIVAPGTLDGGDVLVVGQRVLVGLSERTNAEGVGQLREILEPFGYEVVGIPVAAGLHFKSSVNQVAGDVLLVTREFASHPALGQYELLIVPAGDEYSANVLSVNNHLLIPAGYPRTRALLEPLGKLIIEIDVSEFRKMDGGLTCLSLRFGMPVK